MTIKFRLKTKGKATWFRVKKVLEKANIVLEVLDSRNPLDTRSLELEKLAKSLGKKLVLVLSKTDLVPRDVVERWVNFFCLNGYNVVAVNAKNIHDIRKLKNYVKSLVKEKLVIVAVVGYPNVGKSTIINGLKGYYVAETSPIPGFTKGEKLVKIDKNLFIVDTPGVLPLTKKLGSYELVVRGFIPPEKLKNPVTPALKFLEEVLSLMPNVLRETYGVEAEEPYKFLELLAARRGFLVKGGEVNVDEAAKTVLRDWQFGKLKFYRTPVT
ncbi:MAG: YlqF/YawG family GTPase [Candidatus Bathyarchaeota archaeon]